MTENDPTSTVEVLAVGAHPDDVEIGCGGTLASLRRRGSSIGLLHLTRGEAGTRGTAELRRREAERSAEILGASTLDFLDCGDGALRTGPSEEDAVIRVLRRRRPEIVLMPPAHDRHPDHGRAHRLVRDACYYAGLLRREAASDDESEQIPHRPAVVLGYMLHDSFEPAVIVDVSQDFEVKLEALAAYESQLWSPDGEAARGDTAGADRARKADRATKIASRQFHEALVGRARHFGLLIGADYGEPFQSLGPVGLADLRMLSRSELR